MVGSRIEVDNQGDAFFFAFPQARNALTAGAAAQRQTMPLAERTYTCPCCRVVMDRDLNASRNMLSVGQHALAAA